MATVKQQPKSILKKSTYPATEPSTQDRNREVALYHANLIQERKDVEFDILQSTETLMDYPLAAAPYDASNPSPTDAKMFKSLLRPFQPSDYDALIVERNINGRCGYTLCPNPRPNEPGGGKYRLLGMNGNAKDFKVVNKEELEKWCSEACAKRALYVRVQLSETAAWERGAAGYTSQIDLLDEPKSEEDTVMTGIQQMSLEGGGVTDKRQGEADLALERGDKGAAAKTGLVDVHIRENNNMRIPVEAPSLDVEDLSGRFDTMHLRLEGHDIEFGSRRLRRHDDEME